MSGFKFLTLCVCAAFLLWIFPLGIYIKVAQEANLCGGRRAICLCTQALIKKHQAIDGIAFVATAPQHTPMQTDKAGSPQFIMAQKQQSAHPHRFLLFSLFHVLVKQEGSYPSIEHVPITS